MFGRLLRGVQPSKGSGDAPPPSTTGNKSGAATKHSELVSKARVETPEEHVAKALKFAHENNFPQSLSHLNSFAASWGPNARAPEGENEVISPQPPLDKAKVGGMLEELNQLVRRKLEELLRGDDHTAVCSACKILAGLQKLQMIPNSMTDNEGLDTYLEFLEKTVHKEATEIMRLMMEESEASTAGATVLADIFSAVGALIQDALPLVSFFDSGAPQLLVKRVHEQTTKHAVAIFDLFTEELNLSDTVQHLQTHDHNTNSEYATSLIDNPLQLDETLQTISLMCAYTTRYIVFIKSKDSSVDCGQLHASLQLLLGFYLALESFYIGNAVNEAINPPKPEPTIDNTGNTKPNFPNQNITNPTPNSPSQNRLNKPNDANTTNNDNKVDTEINNMRVDNTFFVIKKCVRRGLSTLDANVACAVVNAAGMAMDNPFMTTLASHLSKISSSPQFFFTNDIFFALNDLELTLEYIGKLHKDMAGDVARLYTVAGDKSKLTACLDDIVKSITNAANRLRSSNLAIYGDKLNVQIESLFLSLFRPINYELDENTYEQAEINDPFMLRLIDGISEALQPAQTNLRDSNKSELAIHISKFISTKFEQAVLMKRFTSLGAIQLSKEVRMLGDYFVTVGGQLLRYQFTRLAQISQLLNLDRVIDCMEYWIEGKAVFKLDANEVRQVLSRRVDFAMESINALKL